MGLAEGQSPLARVAPFGAHAVRDDVTTPRGTYGPRAVVLPQVKAFSLVQTFGLLFSHRVLVGVDDQIDDFVNVADVDFTVAVHIAND